MEQNQNAGLPNDVPQIQSQLPNTDDKQWQKIRNQFASNEQSIGKPEDVIALIQKWIWIQSEQEFKQYQRQLEQRQPKRKLKEIIGQIVQQEKQGSWMINQKYSMQDVNQLVVKLRASIQSILSTQINLNPESKTEEAQQPKQPEKVQEPPIEVQQIDKSLTFNLSSLLPQIKPKGRIYNPKQLTSSFHLLKETGEDYQIKSPYMFSARQKDPDTPRQNIFGSKYLKLAFKQLCKQGYNSKGLFQDFSKDADKMSLNKWMVFCKEFDFIDKFHKSQLVSIFQTATKFSSVMYLEDFLSAVTIIQEKYVNKFQAGDCDFVGEILQIGSEAALRVKMDNLKVKFSGPRQNFFEYSTYLQNERQYMIEKEKAFKVRRREREIVLIKGMFEEHLKDQINQLKAKREQRKNNQLGYSMSMIQTKKQDGKVEVSTPHKSKRIQNLNYSKLFQMNRGNTVQKQSNTTTTNTNLTDRNMYRTDLAKNQSKPRVEHKKIDARTFHSSNQSSINKNTVSQHGNISNENKNDSSIWLTKLRSDSQQSDQILKEHLQLQKKVKMKQSDRIGDLMREMQQQSKKVETIRQEIIEQNETDRDLDETQAYFKREKV